jgi:hypothetical protein
MTNSHQWAALLILAGFLASCSATGSADCDFWTEPPYSNADIDAISEPFKRWLDQTTSSADRICP